MSERWPGDEHEESDVLEVEDDRLEEEEHVHELPLEEEPLISGDEEEGGDTPVPGGATQQHAGGELDIPDDVDVIEGMPEGGRRNIAIVASRFNGEITNRLLESALAELDKLGVRREAIVVMPVPGAFELPLAAMALAKTRRYACIVALGAVVRGDTPHFEYVASECASGLQLAGIETGVPVSFGVLTLETADRADGRIEKGAEAVRSALEMADLFSQLRSPATSG